ncbi:hypothetical protein [Nocardia callitridis]
MVSVFGAGAESVVLGGGVVSVGWVGGSVLGGGAVSAGGVGAGSGVGAGVVAAASEGVVLSGAGAVGGLFPLPGSPGVEVSVLGGGGVSAAPGGAVFAG